MERGGRTDKAEIAAGIQSSKSVDPTQFLENHGYRVKWQGRHASVIAGQDEEYRLTRTESGYLWTDRHGNKGGDNIDLVREIKGHVKLSEALFELNGAPSAMPAKPRPAMPKREPLNLGKPSEMATAKGREYLASRHIDKDVIAQAEKDGFLTHTERGVLFTGRDEKGQIRSATFRATDACDTLQKKDLSGSDKSFPPILPGNAKSVWIVEGGADALALHSMAKVRNQEPPTVIVSGGVGVRNFLDNERVRKLLQGAENVVIASETEKDAPTQEKADAQRARTVEKVAEITGRQPDLYTPNKGKDLSAHHSAVTVEKDAADAAERERRAKIAEAHKKEAAEREAKVKEAKLNYADLVKRYEEYSNSDRGVDRAVGKTLLPKIKEARKEAQALGINTKALDIAVKFDSAAATAALQAEIDKQNQRESDGTGIAD